LHKADPRLIVLAGTGVTASLLILSRLLVATRRTRKRSVRGLVEWTTSCTVVVAFTGGRSPKVHRRVARSRSGGSRSGAASRAALASVCRASGSARPSARTSSGPRTENSIRLVPFSHRIEQAFSRPRPRFVNRNGAEHYRPHRPPAQQHEEGHQRPRSRPGLARRHLVRHADRKLPAGPHRLPRAQPRARRPCGACSRTVTSQPARSTPAPRRAGRLHPRRPIRTCGVSLPRRGTAIAMCNRHDAYR
jgi:hypothetical protein